MKNSTSAEGKTARSPAPVAVDAEIAAAAAVKMEMAAARQRQVQAVRAMALLYICFFVALAAAVLVEGFSTNWWTSADTPGTSVLTGIAALSGFISKAMALMNFLFGFGGGIFVTPTLRESRSSTLLRQLLFFATAVLIVVSLGALWSVASVSFQIASQITDFVTGTGVQDAIAVLGLMNLSMAAGFLVGMAVPGAAAIFGNSGAFIMPAAVPPSVSPSTPFPPPPVNPNEGKIPLAEE